MLSLGGLWFLAMVLEALGVPVWALAMNGALLLVNLIALIAAIHQATRENHRREGGGGLRLPRSDLPDPGGAGEPSGWPELEREVAQYLAERERGEHTPQPVLVGEEVG